MSLIGTRGGLTLDFEVDVTGSAVWGLITGTVTDQTDLISYLSGNYYPLATNPAGYLTSAITRLNTLTATTQLFANGTSGTAPAFVSAIDTHTLNIPSASTSGVTAGTISKVEYDIFNGKQNAITTGTTAQYFRGDLSLATFPTLVSSFTNDAGYLTSASLTGYVPYTGATSNVSIGHFSYIGDALKAFDSAGVLIESANGTDVGLLGVANTANVIWYGSHNFSAATQDTIAAFVGSGKTLSSLDTATYPSLTELINVKGVTSPIQTQIDSKQPQLNGTGFVKATGTTISYDNSTYLTAAITSLNGLTGATQTFANGSTGTAPAFVSATSTHTLNIPMANGVGVTAGLISKTQFDSFLTSSTGVTSVTGTLNRITVTGTTTPVIDISATYVGQSSITTLGTITTGVWNGTAIANANLANSSLTIGSTTIALGATSTTLAGLTSVTSTTFVGALTGNASTATALATARTIGTITGDATSAGSSFDGTANNTNALTLATVNSNVGAFGSATQAGTFTVNAKGLITAASNVTITPAIGSITGLGTGVSTALAVNVGTAGSFVVNGGALGTPSSGTLTNATGLPLTTGVTGILPVANGGTGTSTAFTANAVVLAGASGVYTQDITALSVNPTTNFVGMGIGASPAAQLDQAGSISAAAWTSTGIKIRQRAATLTDTSSSGTVASNYVNAYGAQTLAASSVTTYTTAIGNFYQAPVAGSNVTIGNNITSYIQGNGVISGNLTIGTSISAGARIFISGNTSQSAWGVNGALIRLASATHTDTSSSGTVASAAMVGLNAGAIAASSTTTYTYATGLYITAPTEGSNVTITNSYSLYSTGNMLTTGTMSVGSSVAQTAKLGVSGALSIPAWGTAGSVFRTVAATHTDTSTAASGTVTNMMASSFGTPTFAATNASVTATNAATVYIASAPSGSANLTITNPYALLVAAGKSLFTGGIVLGAGTTTVAPAQLTSGTNKTTAASGDVEYDGTSLFFTNSGLQRQTIAQTQETVTTSDFSKTSDTTLADVTGLTATLVAGKRYRFIAELTGTSNASGGAKFAIGGTATATSIKVAGIIQDSASGITFQSKATALGTAVGGATSVSDWTAVIKGVITVNAAGTLTVQFAQNASSGTGSVVSSLSTFVVTQMV